MPSEIIKIDGKEVTIVFNRPKRSVLRELRKKHVTVYAVEKKGMSETQKDILTQEQDNDMNEFIIGIFIKKLLKRIEGKFPTKKDSPDIHEFIEENQLKELTSLEHKKAFLAEYYSQELIDISAPLFRSEKANEMIDSRIRQEMGLAPIEKPKLPTEEESAKN